MNSNNRKAKKKDAASINISYEKLYPDPIRRRRNMILLEDGFEFSFDNESWQSIKIPFCPESAFSGIGYTGFIRECYYRKNMIIPELKEGERVMLKFGAVDYMATVFVNGKYIGSHIGGYTPFSFDITACVKEGSNLLYIMVRDDFFRTYPSGKQTRKLNSYGCFYTRTTGIWQPVWLEFVPQAHICDFYFFPDVRNGKVRAEVQSTGEGVVGIEVLYNGRRVGYAEKNLCYRGNICVPLAEKHLWGPGRGNLYDVIISYGDDRVESYFGLREVAYRKKNFTVNGKKCFLRFVLDQGYYKDGIYTAPSVADMQKDIDIATALGFNGARLHQKVFDPRFLYLCDKAGYMIWGEFPSWGVDYSDCGQVGEFLSQWGEVLQRDFNHPSIITWCPLNEVWGDWEDARKKSDTRFGQIVYKFTKMLDTTRPCIDVSGGRHGAQTDLFDFHTYESAPMIATFLQKLSERGELDVPLLYHDAEDKRYDGKLPVNVSECGGFALMPERKEVVKSINETAVQSEADWGYGKGVQSAQEFVDRYRELTQAIHNCKAVSGFCYTQLYDVEQEVNGFYTYERGDKFTEEQKKAIKEINLSLR